VRRPAGVAVAALLLWLVAVAVALLGVAATLMSSCCGSADPPDSGPMLLGLVVAVLYAVAGTCLWTGRPNRVLIVALTGVLPIVHAALLSRSSDAATIFLPVLVAWAGLCVLLRSATTASWFSDQRGRGVDRR